MNYSIFIFFLMVLSFLSLLLLFLLSVMDLAKTSPQQRLILLKIGFSMIALAPICFILIRMQLPDAIKITLPVEFSNQNISPNSKNFLIKNQIYWSAYLLVSYLIGLTYMLLRIVCSYLSANRLLYLSTPVTIEGELVFKCEHIKSPLCFGLIKPKIFFPAEAESRWTKRAIQLGLAHEKHHLKHYDTFWKLLSHFIQALLFFTPWMYYLTRRFEFEMEVYCDANVCLTTGASMDEYGQVLLAMACVQSQNYVFNNITDSTLRRRLIAMKTKTKNSAILASVLISILLITGSSALVMAGGLADKENHFKISSKIIVDGKVVANPVILAKENQKAMIVIANANRDGAQGLKMKLVAQNAKMFRNTSIAIDYEIEYKYGGNEIRANPRMVVTANQEEKIQLSSDAEHSYEMQVVAERA